MLPPEVDPEADYKADYDLFIWGWGGDVDPNSLLEIFTCGQIGNTSDSLYCNPAYDELFTQQNEADGRRTPARRFMDQMQEIVYNEAPYHILFYDAALHAYRTDRFTNWVNQPDNGTPLFGYGPYGYTQLQLAGAAEPSAEPTDPGARRRMRRPRPRPTAAARRRPTAPAPSAPPLIAGILGLVAIAVVGLILIRRRRTRDRGGRVTERADGPPMSSAARGGRVRAAPAA